MQTNLYFVETKNILHSKHKNDLAEFLKSTEIKINNTIH